MYKAFAAALLSTALAACGGGGAAQAPDNSAAIQQALNNIKIPGVSTTPLPAYTGAFAAVNNVAIGFVAGTSDDAVAMAIAKSISDAPSTNAANYKLLLSDAGLPIKVFGASIPGQKSAITGMSLYYPDINYVAKLTNVGLTVVRV